MNFPRTTRAQAAQFLSDRIGWLVAIAAWVIAGVLYSAQSYYYRTSLGAQVEWLSILIYDGMYFILWAVFSPLVVWLARRFPIEAKRWISGIGVHLVAAVLVAVLQRGVYDLIFMPLRATVERPFTGERFYYSVVGTFDYGVLIYCIILFVTHALEFYQRSQRQELHATRLQAELAAAQLQALRMQLHPHFLFNTLNTIAVLIREDSAAAGRMVELLSDLLRRALASGADQMVPLREELDFLNLYLEIEQTRFGDRLTVRIDVATAALEAEVPAFVLQPLVENAIRHGIARRPGEGILAIGACQQDGMLELSVRDNGFGVSSSADGGGREGIGLANTRARLQTLYGDLFRLTLSTLPEGGTMALVAVPFRIHNAVQMVVQQ